MSNTGPRNNWAKTAPEGTVRRLTLPSGNEADAIRVGMEGLVRAGIVAEGDSLTAVVDQKHIRRVRGGKGADRDEINAESLLNDPEAFGKVVMVVDRIMPHVLISPTVKLHFEDVPKPGPGQKSTRRLGEGERDPDQAYTDQIPMEDKMFLFNWAVGGTADAERFRRESDDIVADVEDGGDVPLSPQRAAGRKKHRSGPKH